MRLVECPPCRNDHCAHEHCRSPARQRRTAATRSIARTCHQTADAGNGQWNSPTGLPPIEATGRRPANTAAPVFVLETGRTYVVTRPLTVVQLLPALESGGVGAARWRSTGRWSGRTSDLVISAGGRLNRTAGCRWRPTRHPGYRPQVIGDAVPHPALRRAVQEIRPDIVHVRSRLPAWLANGAERPGQARRKVVTVRPQFRWVATARSCWKRIG